RGRRASRRTSSRPAPNPKTVEGLFIGYINDTDEPWLAPLLSEPSRLSFDLHGEADTSSGVAVIVRGLERCLWRTMYLKRVRREALNAGTSPPPVRPE